MGWSPLHASSVALVRHLTTGYLSPQYHVVFDPWFETVLSNDDANPPDAWPVILSNHEHQNFLEDDVTLADEWLTKEELAARRRNEHDLLTSLKPIIKQEGKATTAR